MDNRQDKLNKLINITDEYEVDTNLAQQAIASIEQKKQTSIRAKLLPKQPKRVEQYGEVAVQTKVSTVKWASIVACCMLLVCLSVVLPVYFSSQNKTTYYSDELLEFEYIEDVQLFQQEHNIQFKYFSYPTVQTQVAKIAENNQVAYLSQRMIYINDTGFDTVSLNIVVLTEAQYEFSESFNAVSDEIVFSNISILYKVSKCEEGNLYYAKFAYARVEYYLEISTSEDNLEKITQYVNLLIN